MTKALRTREDFLARVTVDVTTEALQALRSLPESLSLKPTYGRDRRWVKLRAYCDEATLREDGLWGLPMMAGLFGMLGQVAQHPDEDPSAVILRFVTIFAPVEGRA